MDSSPRISGEIVSSRKSGSPKRIYLCRMQDCTKRDAGGGFCVRHGGGRRCEVDGCNKAVQGRGGRCKSHGGGSKCKQAGCSKNSAGRGLCFQHGGGKKCMFQGCNVVVDSFIKYCSHHAYQSETNSIFQKVKHAGPRRIRPSRVLIKPRIEQNNQANAQKECASWLDYLDSFYTDAKNVLNCLDEREDNAASTELELQKHMINLLKARSMILKSSNKIIEKVNQQMSKVNSKQEEIAKRKLQEMENITRAHSQLNQPLQNSNLLTNSDTQNMTTGGPPSLSQLLRETPNFQVNKVSNQLKRKAVSTSKVAAENDKFEEGLINPYDSFMGIFSNLSTPKIAPPQPTSSDNFQPDFGNIANLMAETPRFLKPFTPRTSGLTQVVRDIENGVSSNVSTPQAHSPCSYKSPKKRSREPNPFFSPPRSQRTTRRQQALQQLTDISESILSNSN